MTFGLQTNNNIIKKGKWKGVTQSSLFIRPFEGDETKTKCFSPWQVKEFDVNVKVK